MSRVRPPKAFRRVMRQLPDAMRAEMVDVLTKTGPEAASLMSGRVAASTHRRTGRLSAGLKFKVFPKTLRLEVGLLGTKAGRRKLFYGRILDLGRKAQTVTAKRAGGRTYALHVKAIAPKRFVTGGLGALKGILNRKLNGVWDRGLARIGGGK